MQGRKQPTEKLFLSFQLSERVPEDNFYRKLKNLLDLKWLYKQTQKYYGSEGQQSIDPVVFFKLILIGYLENLGSDRRIISTVSMRMDMLYFIGYDIDEPLPWHSTLSRTQQLYGDDLFKQLFKQVLKQCIDKGMVAGKRQAIDSVFVKANASMNSLAEKDILDDGDDYASALSEDEPVAPTPQQTQTVSAAINKRVQQHHAWKQKAYKGMPGARVNTPRQLNYLGQVSTDTAHHVITNIEAHYADKKDSQCLVEILINTLDNLHTEGLVVEEILADTGYSSGEALKALDEKNIVGYIPNFGQYKPTREGFTYDKEHDRYTCTRGTHLIFKKIKTSPLGYVMRHYRSSAKDCKNCPLKATCIVKATKRK
jgi:transposase